MTLLGIVKEPVKPLQPSKADFPIVVTLLGIVKEPVKPLQLLKANLPICVIPFLSTNDVGAVSKLRQGALLSLSS